MAEDDGVVEATWVRSVYLYLMCAASVVLVLAGLATAIVGLVHTVAPDLGHRDTLDRVGIGASNIADGVIELFNEVELERIEDLCEDVTDTDDDFEDCVEDEQSFNSESIGSIQQGVAEVKDELRSQIRNSSVDAVIRGLLMAVAGFLLFHVHGSRTELFAGGLVPKRRVVTTIGEPPQRTINPFGPPPTPPGPPTS